jgi:hypothetical protein
VRDYALPKSFSRNRAAKLIIITNLYPNFF